MIRNKDNRLAATPARRIAIVQIPRRQRARMGSIGPTPPPVFAWTTIQDETPDSSNNWLSTVLVQQSTTRQTTPGTLVYTPASDTPAANVAPWNSWLSPNCSTAPATDPAPAAAAAAAPTTGHTDLFLICGLVTAAAAALYMVNTLDSKRRF